MSNIINKYAKPITYIDENDDTANYDDNGRPVDNTDTEHTVDALVLPMTTKDLQLYESGKYSTDDKKIYFDYPVYNSEDTQIEIKPDNQVEVTNRFGDEVKYELQREKDYSDFGLLYFVGTKVIE